MLIRSGFSPLLTRFVVADPTFVEPAELKRRCVVYERLPLTK